MHFNVFIGIGKKPVVTLVAIQCPSGKIRGVESYVCGWAKIIGNSWRCQGSSRTTSLNRFIYGGNLMLVLGTEPPSIGVNL